MNDTLEYTQLLLFYLYMHKLSYDRKCSNVLQTQTLR